MNIKSILKPSLIVFLIAGILTLPLPYSCYGWIPGILFVLCAIVGTAIFINGLNNQVDAFDKKLTSKGKEQLSMLFNVVGLVFLFYVGVVLIWRPDFHDVQKKTSFSALIHVAHRYAGYNYYDDAIGLNTFLLLCSFSGAILLGGVLITTFTNIVQEKKDEYLTGTARYKVDNHFIILGMNEVVFTLCRELMGGNEIRTIILTNQDLGAVRSKLHSKLSEDIYNRIILYSGSIEEIEILRSLNIETCKAVYILGEQDAIGHDSIGLGILRSITSLLPETFSRKLKVYLQMDSQSSFSVIQKLDVPYSYTSKPVDTEEFRRVIDLYTFNLYENQARRLWGYYKDSGSWELDFSDIAGPLLLPDSKKRVNLVIAGFDRMGQALLLEALRVCHYPNYMEKNKRNRTIITLIDKNMDELWPQFMARYPNLMQIEDVEIKHYSESLESPHIRQLLDYYAKDENELLTIAICFWDPDTSFAAGLSLPDSIYFSVTDGQAINNSHTRVLIRNESNTGIKDIISEEKKHPSRYKNVKFFGSIEDGLSHSLLDDKAAILQNAHFDTAFGVPSVEKKAGIYNDFVSKFGPFEATDKEKQKFKNYSILSKYQDGIVSAKEVLVWARLFWDETPENHRCSNRYQIEMYGIYEMYLRPLKECVPGKYEEIISQMEHRRWCAERFIMGYQFENYTKTDPIKKNKDFWRVHNDLVPFSELTDKEKAKDLVYLTISTIKDIITKTNNLIA